MSVDIKYNGSSIATMSASGTKTLKTSGKYCESDITVEYTSQEAQNALVLDITVSSDVTASESVLIGDLSGISSHLNDATLAGAFFCLTTENVSKPRAICGAVQKNELFISYGASQFYGIGANNSGSTVQFAYKNYPLNNSYAMGGTMHIENNKLYIRTLGGTRELYAGDYRAVISW